MTGMPPLPPTPSLADRAPIQVGIHTRHQQGRPRHERRIGWLLLAGISVAGGMLWIRQHRMPAATVAQPVSATIESKSMLAPSVHDASHEADCFLRGHIPNALMTGPVMASSERAPSNDRRASVQIVNNRRYGVVLQLTGHAVPGNTTLWVAPRQHATFKLVPDNYRATLQYGRQFCNGTRGFIDGTAGEVAGGVPLATGAGLKIELAGTGKEPGQLSLRYWPMDDQGDSNWSSVSPVENVPNHHLRFDSIGSSQKDDAVVAPSVTPPEKGVIDRVGDSIAGAYSWLLHAGSH